MLETIKMRPVAVLSCLLLYSCGSSDEQRAADKSNSSEDSLSIGISLPKDQFGHEGAPTEWWWHTGTLLTEDGRAFGFEINATGMKGTGTPYAHTQIEITDSTLKKNYQNNTVFIPRPENWCQYDPKGDWHVTLEKAGGTKVNMTSLDGDPTHMKVTSSFTNTADGTSCALDLELVQDGPPLLMWGNGVHENVDTSGTSPITKNHYYYSLTRIQASGILVVGADTFEVSGTTWMDHQYGAFPKMFKWIHQNVQLDNNIQLTNYTNPGQQPELNTTMDSKTSILLEDGTTIFVDSKTTPLEPIFTLENTDYFMQFKVEIVTEEITAEFMISSLLGNQVLIDPKGNNLYEGVSSCKGTYNGEEVTGTAWIEENL